MFRISQVSVLQLMPKETLGPAGPRVSRKMNDQTRRAIQRAAEAIASSEALLITAGAGMSVDSGLPDFRGPEGFWRAYPPLQKLGLSFADMAQPHWFDKKS